MKNPAEEFEPVPIVEDNKPGDHASLPEELDREDGAAAGVQYLIAVAAKKKGACLHLAEGCWRAKGRFFSSWEPVEGDPWAWLVFSVLQGLLAQKRPDL